MNKIDEIEFTSNLSCLTVRSVYEKNVRLTFMALASVISSSLLSWRTCVCRDVVAATG
jgi:hypothetical protein